MRFPQELSSLLAIKRSSSALWAARFVVKLVVRSTGGPDDTRSMGRRLRVSCSGAQQGVHDPEALAPNRFLRRRVIQQLACHALDEGCLLYTSPSPRDRQKSRMP